MWSIYYQGVLRPHRGQEIGDFENKVVIYVTMTYFLKLQVMFRSLSLNIFYSL